MGIKFITNDLQNGKKSIDGCFIENNNDNVSGLIVTQQNGSDIPRVAFAIEIDWENRTIIPCYADYRHDIVLSDDRIVTM